MIPKLHYISQGNSAKEQLENIQNACTSGIELIQLGDMKLADKKLLKIAAQAREITAHFQTRLVITNHYKIAKEVKADGVYFKNTHLSPTMAKKHLYTWQMMGGEASTLQDAEALIKQQIDYVTLGPFRSALQQSSSLGLNGFTVITEALNTKTPIIGVGGIRIQDVKGISKTGVSGIAVAEEITQNFNTIRTFNQLLNASVIDEQRHTF